MLYLCLSYDPIWHSAVELRVATAISPELRINQHLAQIKTKGNQRPEVEMGLGALSARKKQGLKISPKPLFVIGGVPKGI
jgi:hypothetical protein